MCFHLIDEFLMNFQGNINYPAKNTGTQLFLTKILQSTIKLLTNLI